MLSLLSTNDNWHLKYSSDNIFQKWVYVLVNQHSALTVLKKLNQSVTTKQKHLLKFLCKTKP